MNESARQIFDRLRRRVEAYRPGDMMPSVVSALEFRREQYGLSAAAWSALLGVPASHYSEFVGGGRNITRGMMARAYRLGVPAEVLLQPEGGMRVSLEKRPPNKSRKLTPEELRAYNREAKRRSRERARLSTKPP